jgi:hypothetical protein
VTTTGPPRSAESESRRLTVMRQGLARDQTKYSAGGREKQRKRAVPSMPKLRCLEDQAARGLKADGS